MSRERKTITGVLAAYQWTGPSDGGEVRLNYCHGVNSEDLGKRFTLTEVLPGDPEGEVLWDGFGMTVMAVSGDRAWCRHESDDGKRWDWVIPLAELTPLPEKPEHEEWCKRRCRKLETGGSFSCQCDYDPRGRGPDHRVRKERRVNKPACDGERRVSAAPAMWGEEYPIWDRRSSHGRRRHRSDRRTGPADRRGET